MSKAFTYTLIFLLSAVFVYGPMETVAPNPITASIATISVDPSTIRAEVDQTFVIGIKISDVIDLYGWEFKLRWNSALLDVLNITEGTFLKGGGDTFFVSKINNTLGYMLVDCSLMGDVPGASGNGILATVEFYVETRGECVLDLYDTKLVNSNEQPVTHITIDGNFRAIVRDVAITSVTTSKTVAVVGEIVDIAVVAENEGTETETFNVTVHYDNVDIETQAVNNMAAGANTTLTFSWNTTGLSGYRTISATASVVSGETDIADNTYTDGTVYIIPPYVDVSVDNVEPYRTIIGQNSTTMINVTVSNLGGSTGPFNITLYANTTTIQTQETSITSGYSKTLTFQWTTPSTLGNYTIRAVASQVENETIVANNEFVYGTIEISIPGDINADGIVNIIDVAKAARAFETKPGYQKWNANADVNEDKVINIIDIATIAREFGKTT